jgi:nicotinate phosphoribosyltransferase
MSLESLGIYTDLYELKMAQGYYLTGRAEEPACFDYFFRKAPFAGSYVIFSGLRTLFERIEYLKFGSADLNYLQSIGFKKEFLEFLSSFTFNGTIYSPEEGDLVFPKEPIVRVEGSLLETQLLETLLLNTLNFESLIATKASRIRCAAADKHVSEFGLRRAQSFGGLYASRASIIGGADSTSNVLAGKLYGCEVSGTVAHSWIQSFSSEHEAFSAYAKQFPEHCVLLVDTYNTIESGIPNAIKVAIDLKEKGYALNGVRLDSGEMVSLSKISRQMLNEAGLKDVKIIVSNQLDEFVIEELLEKGAPIDVFGVGTSLATGSPDAALDGVYKLSYCNGLPKLKLSEVDHKITWPGHKKVIRFENDRGEMIADGVFLKDEEIDILQIGSTNSSSFLSSGTTKQELLKLSWDKGKSLLENKNLPEIREFSLHQISKLPKKYKRLKKSTAYPVGFSNKLISLRQQLVYSIREESKK